MNAQRPVGEQLREWRQRRCMSQSHLADMADTSTRHVSFIETGRALPSRTMLIRLAGRLNVPLRERNALLAAAGFAPLYQEHRLDDPSLEQARAAVDLVLAGHLPYPALAIDRHWNMIKANPAVAPFLAGVAPELLRPPVNIMRLSLHPQGMAPRIVNFPEIRLHLLERLQQQASATFDPVLQALHAELSALPVPADVGESASVQNRFALQLKLRTERGVLSFISTTTVFGTPMDVTLAEMAIESFFPADAATATALRSLMDES